MKKQITILVLSLVFVLAGCTSIKGTEINREEAFEERNNNIEPFKECLFGVCRADVPAEIECSC